MMCRRPTYAQTVHLLPRMYAVQRRTLESGACAYVFRSRFLSTTRSFEGEQSWSARFFQNSISQLDSAAISRNGYAPAHTISLLSATWQQYTALPKYAARFLPQQPRELTTEQLQHRQSLFCRHYLHYDSKSTSNLLGCPRTHLVVYPENCEAFARAVILHLCTWPLI